MNFTINHRVYHLVDSLEGIASKDSFTDRANKIGAGNGASEWHIGSKNNIMRYNFFGGHQFNIRCFLKKSDLLNLLNEMQLEYLNPSQNYREKMRMNEVWQERYNEINALTDEYLFFNLREHDNRNATDARLYAKKPGNETYGNMYYALIRKLMLPHITFASILKLMNSQGDILYYFKIFTESNNESFKDIIEETQLDIIQETQAIPETERLQLVKSRIGQGIFRDKLLLECPICPITLIDDSRFLIASHIKPWRVSSNLERLDVKNGLLFTPTYDKLFDGGYISFNNRKELLISPILKEPTKSRFNIEEGRIYPNLFLRGREPYLEYHRTDIFKK
jgi:putative restriction endonuclease